MSTLEASNFQDAGMILEEQPAKVAEAVKLFLQGTIFTIFIPFYPIDNHSSLLSSVSMIAR